MKKHHVYSLLLLLHLFSLKISAQQILVSDTINILPDNTLPGSHYHQLNLETCTDSFFNFSVQVNGLTIDSISYSVRLFDIAKHPNPSPGYSPPADIYAVRDTIPNLPEAYNLFNFHFGLYRSISDTSLIDIGTVNGLTSDYKGKLWASGAGLHTFDPQNRVLEFKGNFPQGMQSSGDLVWVLDKLYMSTISNTLIEVDTINPMNSTVVMNFPTDIEVVDALAVLPFQCDSIVIYAMERKANGTSTVHLLDIAEQTLTPVCDYNFAIFGATTDIEYILPPCNLSVDLNEDDSGGWGGNDHGISLNCSASSPVVDDDFLVRWPIPLDSMHIELTDIQDIGFENLIFPIIPASLQLQDNGSKFTLINLGDATVEDFSTVLAGILYQNDAVDPLTGIRNVVFTTYAWEYEGTASTTSVNITNDIIVLDALIYEPTCFEEATGSVELNAINGQSPYSFVWPDGISLSNRDNLPSAEYEILITDHFGCEGIDTIFIPENDSLFVNITAPLDSICGAAGSLTALPGGGTTPYSYSWNLIPDNSPVINNLSPNTYMLQLTDSLGCIAQNNYTLFAADTVFTSQQLSECEGTPIIYQGQQYNTDTTFCINTTSIAGCDSIHCVSLIFQDTFYQFDQYQLCQGESLEWQGNTYEQDTSLCQTYINDAGCDSTYCLELSFLSRISNLQAQICEGSNYDFNGQIISQAGIYQDTLSDGGLCDSIIILELSYYPPQSVAIQSEGSLCAGEEVSLSAQGNGQYMWSTGAVTPSIIIENAGVYYLSLTDANGCTSVDSTTLSDEAPDLLFSTTDPNCPDAPNGSISIDSVWGGSLPYLFSLNDSPMQSQTNFQNLEAGVYTLSVEDVAGCRRSYDLTLANQATLNLSLGSDRSVTLGENVLLNPMYSNPESIASILWQPIDFLSCDTCLNPVSQPIRTITYQLVITDSLGCVLSDDITITVEQKEELYIPNAFSPNEDGRNDRLIIFGSSAVASIESLQVFDRWGGLVYERQDFLPNTEDEQNWDGIIRGEAAPVGLYIYQLRYTDITGTKKVVSGEINLLR